ncbi:hypothetical protein GCM10023084_03580 [Streptomyces lacrimifluminis]|uniref:hypothetical protein n=1 Tax=Streptomyces lacrimifluminis TaxID=1500077 RepID=UPI0031E60DA4
MSSPLDNRMRVIARAEAEALLGVPGGVPAAAEPGPTAEQLQEQIAELRDRLDALEKAPERAGQEDRPTARRPAKKTGMPPTPPE